MLALVVAVPFYVSSLFVVLLIAGAAWLGLTGLSIPVGGPRDTRRGAATRPGAARRCGAGSCSRASPTSMRSAWPRRSSSSSWCFSVVLSVALSAYADNPLFVAQALAQIVLAPFFFLGLTVLYFDQRARASEHRPGAQVIAIRRSRGRPVLALVVPAVVDEQVDGNQSVTQEMTCRPSESA